MRKRRSKCAVLICDYIDGCSDFLNMNDGDPQWTKSKIIVEDVIDYFEKLAYFTKQGDFPFETVYDLYSYYVQGYWELCSKSLYIQRVRQQPNGDDFFADFEWLYNKLLTRRNLKPYNIEDFNRFCREERALTDTD
jgi:hypothetical protein